MIEAGREVKSPSPPTDLSLRNATPAAAATRLNGLTAMRAKPPLWGAAFGLAQISPERMRNAMDSPCSLGEAGTLASRAESVRASVVGRPRSRYALGHAVRCPPRFDREHSARAPDASPRSGQRGCLRQAGGGESDGEHEGQDGALDDR